METQHTPGPWEVVARTDGRRVTIKAGLASVATVSITNVDFSFNARLIAAAPEMREALIDCRRALEIANFTQELAIVNAAIAKATQQ